MGAAVEQYAAEHNGEWPEDIVAEDGRPLLSWRVRILEQLGYPELYRRFDIRQAWNSASNRAPAYTPPRVYQCPSTKGILTDESLRCATNYFLVKSAAGELQVREIGQFFVVWTRPTSLSAAEFATIERIASTMHGDTNNAAVCDSHPSRLNGTGEDGPRE